MKFLAIYSLTFLCSMLFAVGEVDHYSMEIKEKGTVITEKIEIDEKRNVEFFHVPAHNNIDAADYYHDFKMRLTATRIPARKVCYISKMNPSLSPPAKLKADFQRAVSQTHQLPVITRSHLVAVTGPANRRNLTVETLDFCGALPIYNTEMIEGDSVDNGKGNTEFRLHRQKRQITKNFTSCGDFGSLLTCPHDLWNLKCKMKNGACYYFYTCKNMQPRSDTWDCSQEHLTNTYPICCDLACSGIKASEVGK